MQDAATGDFPNLLSGIAFGPVTLTNRAVVAGHTMLLGDSDGMCGNRYRAYLVERARGGAGLVTVESAPVHPASLQFNQQLRLWEPRVGEGLKRTADEVHAAGSKLSIILWHGGRNVSHLRGHVPVAASAIPSPQTGDTPREMAAAEIAEVVDAYGNAASMCAGAGFDVLEVQTSADYLLGSFLSPRLNRRTDAYGGSLVNRVRIVVEILERIREIVGTRLAVGVRTSVAHLIPGDPDGYGRADSLGAMKVLDEARLIDYVSLMTGSNGAQREVIPPMTSPRAGLAAEASTFRRHLRVPVGVAGRIRTPQEAEMIIASGQADFVAMARTFIAEPNWVVKIKASQVNQIRPCMSCSQACFGFTLRGLPAGCVINASAGRELEVPSVSKRARNPQHVAIVGGGPAGMECARIAAERGHRITLFEETQRLGGAMRLAAEAPNRDEMKLPLEWWQSELTRLGVTIKLGTSIADAESIIADVIVWATGATAHWPAVWKMRPQLLEGIPGTANLPHGRNVLAGSEHVAGRVLIIDEEGGWPSVSLAEAIVATKGVTRVTVATAFVTFGAPELAFTDELFTVKSRLKAAGVFILPETIVARVEGAFAITSEREVLGPFESIVLSTGAISRSWPVAVKAIGDCVTPRDIWSAVQDGARLAHQL